MHFKSFRQQSFYSKVPQIILCVLSMSLFIEHLGATHTTVSQEMDGTCIEW